MPITPLKNYNPDEIIAIVGNADIRTWADGVMVSIDYITDQYQEVVGTGGEVARSRSNDYRANITLRLMQTGDDNDLLSEIYRADQLGTLTC